MAWKFYGSDGGLLETVQGSPGPQGPAGADGAAGAAGSAGVPGTFGEDGEAGFFIPAGAGADASIDWAEDADIASVSPTANAANVGTEAAPAGHAHYHGQLAGPSSAHDADDIDVADAGGYFTGAEVEAALQELAAAIGGGGTVISYGAYINRVMAGDRAWVYDDFFVVPGVGSLFAKSASGSLDQTASPSDQNHPGILRAGTVSGASNYSGIMGPNATTAQTIILGTNAVRVGFWVKTDAALSDDTNDYQIRAGLMDSDLSSLTPTNGVYFVYNDNVNAGKWQLVARDNASETTADSGITVAVNTWYYLEIRINAAGTSAEYFIDGTSVGTLTALPTGVTKGVSVVCGIRKTLGTTARYVYIDAAYFLQDLSR